MSSLSKSMSSSSSADDAHEHEHVHDLRRGPWTLEEDTLLVHYITRHGEGQWNLLAKCAGLRRTGKSCRLRWLNYLKPDVKRGNLTPQEQILILDLHSKLGNRWSKIALHLPGRTDNEIKNYWRTRVQKQARHLKVDANSQAFQEIVRCFWMPRLLQKIQTEQNSTISQPVNHIFPDNNLPLPPPLPQNQKSDSNSCISSNISQISQSSSSEYVPCFDSSNNGKFSYYNDSNYYCNMETMNLENLSMSEGFENPIGESYVEEKNRVEYNFGENYTWDELMAI